MAAEKIRWERLWDRVLDKTTPPFYRWFPGGQLNTCFNALDRHVIEGHGDQAAIIHDSPVTGSIVTLTYAELLDRVSRFAGALRSMGVERGDRVVLYLPMVPEAAVGMLACARIGAVHSVVFGGFAAKELATRIDDAKPKVILTATHGVEGARTVAYLPLVDAALSLAEHQPEHMVILHRENSEAEVLSGLTLDWEETEAMGEPTGCVSIEAADPLYILYTSGTTGKPKGVVRDNGGHAVALKWSMQNLYGVAPGEVFWAASDIGWVVGHSYIVYGPLLARSTSIMYEGKPTGTPDAGAYWRVVEQHKAAVMFAAPTARRALRREDPSADLMRRYDLSSLRTLFLAGERCDRDTLAWVSDSLGVPVIDHWWQTETGWPVACNPRGLEPLPIKPGSVAVAAPGFDIRVLDHKGQSVAPGTVGDLALRLPLPPGAITTVWNDQAGFSAAYLERFAGFYDTADAGFVDEDGYLFVMGRTDDIINVAGHRLSTGTIEEAISSHDDVAECAVIGVPDVIKGHVPMGFVVLRIDSERDRSTIKQEVAESVRVLVGPIAALRDVLIVERLPKTRSGKILRSTMRAVANGEAWAMPATIEDPGAIVEIEAHLAMGR